MRPQAQFVRLAGEQPLDSQVELVVHPKLAPQVDLDRALGRDVEAQPGPLGQESLLQLLERGFRGCDGLGSGLVGRRGDRGRGRSGRGRPSTAAHAGAKRDPEDDEGEFGPHGRVS